MSAAPLRDVAVVGDGLAGWTAAAALARRLRGVRVALVPPPRPVASILDAVGIAAPGARAFLRDLRLDEAGFVRATGGSFRLGSLLESWGERAVFHGYGDHGAAHGGVAFHHVWLRAGAGVPAFHLCSAAAHAALAGRFAPGAAWSHGFHFDPAAATALLREAALAAGAATTAAAAGAEIAGSGVVLRLADSAVLRPDLVVDATPDGQVAALLDEKGGAWAREDWRAWLPCDRLLAATRPQREPPAAHDRVASTAAGWRLAVPRAGATTHLLAYAAAHLSDDRAARALRAAAGAEPGAPALPVSPGRRARAFVGNVVAVGEAAVVAEPAEGVQLHLLHAHLDRLIAMLPDTAFAPAELTEYNRQVAQEADRVRDFLALRYHLAVRREPFWREAARVALPDALAYDLALFRERGRLPVHDEETFDRESWLALLLGAGVRPRRTDALAAAIAPAEAAALVERARRAGADAAAALPAHAEYLGHLYGRAPA